MENKMECLQQHNTWELVKKEPNMTPIESKKIYRIKTDTNNSVKYKTRLVAVG